MSRRRRRLIPVLAAAAVVAALLPGGSGAAAAPGDAPAAATGRSGPFAEGHHEAADVDNRTGTAAPDARQRGLARRLDSGVRWNRLGTPHALGPTRTPLATGLPADPEAAARRYLADNRELFGLDDTAVAAMDRVLVRPIGDGAVVTLRQRFGDLPAGHDGLVTVAVADGTVLSVSSSLTRDAAAPAPATLTGEQAYAAALADAGLDAAAVARHSIRPVAVPTPLDGNRAAYEVSLIGAESDHPTAFTTYVDGITGKVLVREDLVDFDSDNPSWAVYPATPPTDLAPGQDPRVRWCGDAEPGCAAAFRDPASGRPWDVDLATGPPTGTSRGNSANTVLSWGAGTPIVPATASPERRYEYPFTDQWRQARCNPAVSFLLQAASQVSMLDMRDNMLTADLLRFGGANQDLIWAEFARSGMGRDATTNGAGDTDPTPSFASPRGGNATLTLRPRGDSADAPIRVYVGAYEARATPTQRRRSRTPWRWWPARTTCWPSRPASGTSGSARWPRPVGTVTWTCG
ncbi:M36 family metallopeptidase [Micromonospora sp. B9E7]|uniref:M36 family metallopeptidase n=1 Tax=Micromonospora sp. B9E7 TaxID=3153574 RepID=UPI00325D3781